MVYILLIVIAFLVYFLFISSDGSENRGHILGLLFRNDDEYRFRPSVMEEFADKRSEIKGQRQEAFSNLISNNNLQEQKIADDEIIRDYQFPIINLFSDKPQEILIFNLSVKFKFDGEATIFNQLSTLINQQAATICSDIDRHELTFMKLEEIKKNILIAIRQKLQGVQIIKTQLKRALSPQSQRAPKLNDHHLGMMIHHEPVEFNVRLWLNSSGNQVLYIQQVVTALVNFYFHRALMKQTHPLSPEQLLPMFESFLKSDLEPLLTSLKISLSKYLIPPDQINLS